MDRADRHEVSFARAPARALFILLKIAVTMIITVPIDSAGRELSNGCHIVDFGYLEPLW